MHWFLLHDNFSIVIYKFCYMNEVIFATEYVSSSACLIVLIFEYVLSNANRKTNDKNNRYKGTYCFYTPLHCYSVAFSLCDFFAVCLAGTNRISCAIQGAHEGGIFALCMLRNGTLVSGGGKDRKLVSWDGNYQKIQEVEVRAGVRV